MAAFSDLIHHALRKSGVGHIARFLNRQRCLVLMYHGIVPDDCLIDSWTLVREREFRRQMDILARWYNVVPIDSILKEKEEDVVSNMHGPKAIITFDDGYRNNYTTAFPILKEYCFPATVFICSGFINNKELSWYDKIIYAIQRSFCKFLEIDGREYFFHTSYRSDRWDSIQSLLSYLKTLDTTQRDSKVEEILEKLHPPFDQADCFCFLSSKEILSMDRSDLITIGAHTANHEILTQISVAKARETIDTSKRSMERITGKQIHSFSYPNGDFNNGIMQILSMLGIRMAFTTQNDLYSKKYGNLEIPRVGVGGYDDIDRFIMKSSGFTIHRPFERINYKPACAEE